MDIGTVVDLHWCANGACAYALCESDARVRLLRVAPDGATTTLGGDAAEIEGGNPRLLSANASGIGILVRDLIGDGAMTRYRRVRLACSDLATLLSLQRRVPTGTAPRSLGAAWDREGRSLAYGADVACMASVAAATGLGGTVLETAVGFWANTGAAPAAALAVAGSASGVGVGVFARDPATGVLTLGPSTLLDAAWAAGPAAGGAVDWAAGQVLLTSGPAGIAVTAVTGTLPPAVATLSDASFAGAPRGAAAWHHGVIRVAAVDAATGALATRSVTVGS